MTIAHSARKIIKTQRCIFRALPAVLVSIFVLNACAGAVPVTVSNSSLSEEEIAKLREDAKQANDAKEIADSEIVTLKDGLKKANDAKTTADNDVTRLKNDLATAEGARDTANDMITDLKGKLSTAIGNKDTADGTITTLRGQLSTAEGARDTANDMITDLKKAIRLIEDARINFGDWAGTAEAPKTTVIGPFTIHLLNGATDVGNNIANASPDRNFIQGLPIVAGQGFDFTGTAFADATVTGDVLLLEADSPSGVAFSRVSGTGVTDFQWYAGLLPTTNLGAPITNIDTDAIWNAKVMLIAYLNQYSNLDFKMQVIFDGSEGTINSGTLSGGVFTAGDISVPYTSTSGDTGSHPFNIQGRFGSDGLLYGTVILNAGLGGSLTGLIGADGAVGAFQGLTLNGIGPHAGGFVAVPSGTDPRIAGLEDELSTAKNERDLATSDKNAANLRIAKLEEQLRLIEETRISFIDWAGTARNPKLTVIDSAGTGTETLLNGVASVGDGNGNQSFIQELAIVEGQGFDFTGTAFADATVLGDVLLLAENSPSGVAFSRVTGTSVSASISGGVGFYAGLLPTTNLGAPITNINTDAIWDAKVMLIASPNRYSNSDFKMRVTFDGSEGTINSGTFSGGVFTAGEISVPYTDRGSGGSHPFNIQGRFGSDGLLYGTVILNASSSLSIGRLTGLIGADGAVGAITGFTSTTGVGPFAGGFVAYPSGIDPRIAELEEEIRLIEETRISFIDWAGTAEAPKTTVIDSAGTGTLPLLNGVASVGNGNPVTNFIQGLATNIHGFDFTGTAFSSATTTGGVLLLGEGSPSGVAFSYVTGTGVTGEKLYAGLLPTTNLGAPITDINTNAIWDAKVALISAINLFSINSFKMRVIFDGSEGTINSGTVSDGSFTNGAVSIPSYDGTLNIQGKFGSDGLLYGTVAYDSDTANGTLTGLIGVDGAVGAFVSDFGAGGFVAYPTDPQIAKLEEEIRLIEETRITFADWAGTAEAPKTTVIDTINTGTYRLLNGAASVGVSNPRGNFIQGLPTMAGQGFDFAGTAFSSATVTGDVLLLAENSPSGVAFSAVWKGGLNYNYYAGLLPDTNLGAPITDINTDAIWDAKIGTLLRFGGVPRAYSSPSLKMQVTFDGSAGTISSGTLSSSTFTPGEIVVVLTPNNIFGGGLNTRFNIQGSFGSDGLLYGTVVLNGSNGALTGLIGEDGAVGAFNSGGGFVAYPTDPQMRITELEEELRMAKNDRDSATGDKNAANLRIGELEEELRLAEEARLKEIRDNHYPNYRTWAARVNPDATADTENPRNQILQSNDGTLDTTGVTFCRYSDERPSCGAVGSRTAPRVFNINSNLLSFDGQRINGDINDGYARFFGHIGETLYHYVGILDSTDLGAPLTGDMGTSVEWNGGWSLAGDEFDFVLTITFDAAGGRLDAFTRFIDDQFFRLQNARFDTGGVITGTVNYQRFTDSDPTQPINDNFIGMGVSVLSGIIGEEGVVAVFIGAGNGGFIAGPDITQNPIVQTNDWTRKVGYNSAPATSARRNQFLYGLNDDGFDGGVNASSLNLRAATFNGNPLGGNGGSTIILFSGNIRATRHYYAGLDDQFTANLGVTLPVWQTGQPVNAEWKGQFSVSQGVNEIANADLTLEVNFENRRLTAFVPVGANHYLLEAGFNADDRGFFAGTVNFGVFTDTTNRASTNTLTSGVLTGIIGAEGALGAFVSGSTTDNGRTITGGEGENGFAGGFVACPYDSVNNRCQR